MIGLSLLENPTPFTIDDTTSVSNMDSQTILGKTVLSTDVLVAMPMHQDISNLSVQPGSTTASQEPTTPSPEALLMSTSKVVSQVYNRGNVTKIPWMDESSEWKLLLLLGDWYESETFDSIFSFITSNAVHFSS